MSDLSTIAEIINASADDLAALNADFYATDRIRLIDSLEAKKAESRAVMAKLWAIQAPSTAAGMEAGFEKVWSERIKSELAHFDLMNKPRPVLSQEEIAAQEELCRNAMARDMEAWADQNGGWTGD